MTVWPNLIANHAARRNLDKFLTAQTPSSVHYWRKTTWPRLSKFHFQYCANHRANHRHGKTQHAEEVIWGILIFPWHYILFALKIWPGLSSFSCYNDQRIHTLSILCPEVHSGQLLSRFSGHFLYTSLFQWPDHQSKRWSVSYKLEYIHDSCEFTLLTRMASDDSSKFNKKTQHFTHFPSKCHQKM